MARFLSRAWLEQVAAAAAERQVAEAGPEAPFTVRQVVRGGPDGDVSYSVSMDHGVVTVTPDGTGHADVELASDYDTAVSISKGELSPAVALNSGRLRVSGDLGLLAQHRDAFAGLANLLGPVRATTDY